MSDLTAEEKKNQELRDEFLKRRKRKLTTNSIIAMVGGVGITIGSFILLVSLILEQDGLTAEGILRAVFVVAGVLIAIAGFYGYRRARALTIAEFNPTEDAVSFERQIIESRSYYTPIIVISMVIVFIVEAIVGFNQAIPLVDLNKALVLNEGQWWRILTTISLHTGVIHMLFHGNAIRGFGDSIEMYSNRAHFSIVFLLSSVGGGILSSMFIDSVPTVGASGAVLGLLGYLSIYGYLRYEQLMPGFLSGMLINLGFLLAFGLAAYKTVDNYAHLGGLVIGISYGWIQIPRSIKVDPRIVSPTVKIIGQIALGLFLIICLVSILIMTGVIPQ